MKNKTVEEIVKEYLTKKERGIKSMDYKKWRSEDEDTNTVQER